MVFGKEIITEKLNQHGNLNNQFLLVKGLTKNSMCVIFYDLEIDKLFFKFAE